MVVGIGEIAIGADKTIGDMMIGAEIGIITTTIAAAIETDIIGTDPLMVSHSGAFCGLPLHGIPLVALLEAGVGFWAHSMVILADGLDMASDTAGVYAAALFAIGRSDLIKARIASWSGAVLLVLRLLLLAEFANRALSGFEPRALPMLATAVISLIVNLLVFRSLRPFESGEVHLPRRLIPLNREQRTMGLRNVLERFTRLDPRELLFRVSVWLKGLDGVLELAGGAALLAVGPAVIARVIHGLTEAEITEDPTTGCQLSAPIGGASLHLRRALHRLLPPDPRGGQTRTGLGPARARPRHVPCGACGFHALRRRTNLSLYLGTGLGPDRTHRVRSRDNRVRLS